MSQYSIAAALTLSLALGSCDAIESATVNVAYFQTETSGDLALGPSTGGAPLDERRNDLESDLGVDSSNPAILFGGTIDSEIGHFGASAFWFDQSGTGTLGNDFGDIPLGATVSSKFEFLNVKTYRGLRRHRGPDVPGRARRCGRLPRHVDAGPLEHPLADLRGARGLCTRTAPVPRCGGQAGSAERADADGLDGDRPRGREGDLLGPGEGRVGFTPTEDINVFAGYRYIAKDSSGEADSRDAEVDIVVQGWFLGGEFRF